MHYKLMYPSEYLAAPDLHGKDVKLTIEKVEIEQIPGTDGTKKAKPVVSFKESKNKRMVLNKTCAKAVAKAHGNETESWVGKQIVVYPTTCMAFGQEVECVRVR